MVETAEILGRAEGWGLQADKARGLVARLDPLDAGEVDADACFAALEGEFAQALFGSYKSRAALTLWRRGGGGAYAVVDGAVGLLRTRDASQRAEASTPER